MANPGFPSRQEEASPQDQEVPQEGEEVSPSAPRVVNLPLTGLGSPSVWSTKGGHDRIRIVADFVSTVLSTVRYLLLQSLR